MHNRCRALWGQRYLGWGSCTWYRPLGTRVHRYRKSITGRQQAASPSWMDEMIVSWLSGGRTFFLTPQKNKINKKRLRLETFKKLDSKRPIEITARSHHHRMKNGFDYGTKTRTTAVIRKKKKKTRCKDMASHNAPTPLHEF